MDTGPLRTLLGYELGNFIFDFWQAALFLLLCLLNVWIIGWAHQRSVKAVESIPALSIANVITAFALSMTVSLVDSAVGQGLAVLGAAAALALWHRNRNQSQPFYILALAIAIGALIGFGFFAISLVFSVVCAIALVVQRKPAP